MWAPFAGTSSATGGMSYDRISADDGAQFRSKCPLIELVDVARDSQIVVDSLGILLV